MKVIFKSGIPEGFDDLVDPGSIYEASKMLDGLSLLKLPDGRRITKLTNYKGFELWWFYANALLIHYCLPYTQYRRLLEKLKENKEVELDNCPYPNLFKSYLEAHGIKVTGIAKARVLPFGIILQMFLTLISLPFLMVMRPKILVFIGDKFDKDTDYDFRMKYIYKALRGKQLPFFEVIRSLENWKNVLAHFFKRLRPVVYSEAVIFAGKLFGNKDLRQEDWKIALASLPLSNFKSDIFSIKLTQIILKLIGAKAVYITAAGERNFHTFVASKLLNLPTVGILHGFASRYYNTYDFLPTYDGEARMSVDKYGLWSSWWKEYYLANSKIYKPEQLYISGLMRPLEKIPNPKSQILNHSGPIRVLFISEQLAVPREIIPYLEALLDEEDFIVSFRFRPYRDGFKLWLEANRRDLLKRGIISEGTLQDAISNSDVVVGSHSTAVIESLFQNKPPILFYTNKWGNYFELDKPFLAQTREELIELVKGAQLISENDLAALLEKYFGNPYANGSSWVVDELERLTK